MLSRTPQHEMSPKRYGQLLREPARRGNILVLLAILLPALVGIAGLVIDLGLMTNERRSLQHATDAAATAAAMDLRLGKGAAAATATAEEFIQNANEFADASVTVHIPPASGNYAGRSGYVEVESDRSYQSHFMRILDHIVDRPIHARAVAGVDDVTADAAIIILDPDPTDLSVSGTDDITAAVDDDAMVDEAVDQSGASDLLSGVPVVGPTAADLVNAELQDVMTDLVNDLWADVLGDVAIAPTPSLIAGLEVEGLGQLIVDDAILVNNEWGGVDENGDTVGEATAPPYGVACMPLLPLTRVLARDIRVVGGVDNQDNYQPFEPGGSNPLQANRLPVPDPFLSLPTPSTVSDAANVDATVNDPADVVQISLSADQASQLATDVLAQLPALLQPLFQPLIAPLTDTLTQSTLQPGVYNSITVLAPLGGVRFEPGVYVIRGTSPVTQMSLYVVGPVEAEGVLFYITDESSFDAATGLPDAGDDPSASLGNTLLTTLPSATILPLLDGAHITGLNDPGSPFDGLLIYQRRLDRRPIIIEAQQLLGSGDISGTIYSKWGHVVFLGGFGTYDLRFVCGTMRVVTVTETTLAPSEPLPPATDVLLVE